jgi:ABC-type branched-subunit amino acid transport system substrate-binding protein
MEVRNRILLMLVTLVFVPFFSLRSADLPLTNPVVKIGVILPLTGPEASLGEEMRDALTVAMEDIKDSHYRYEIIFEDDQMSAARTATAAQKLIRIDHVDAIISLSSGTGNVIAPLAEQARVVHMALATDPHVAQGKFNFIHWTQPGDEARTLVSELTKRHIHSIAICELNHQGALAMGDELATQLAAAGIQVTSRNRFNSGERDFRVTLSKIAQEKPEMIYLMLFSPEIELIQKQINEAQMNIPTTSIEGFDISASPALFEGKWYVSASAVPAFLQQRLLSRFNQKHFFVSGHSYDALNLLVQAYEKNAVAGVKPPAETVVADLSQLQAYHSILGPVTISPDKIIHSEVSVKMIKNGESIVLN